MFQYFEHTVFQGKTYDRIKPKSQLIRTGWLSFNFDGFSPVVSTIQVQLPWQKAHIVDSTILKNNICQTVIEGPNVTDTQFNW